jgi:hypothetical protein
LVQRKQAFTEIANSLSTQEIRLSAKDVEKQWKNLKVGIRKNLNFDPKNRKFEENYSTPIF